MPDVVTKQKRSQMMAGIRGKDTTPELVVRKALHRRGFRYSLHNKKLTGKPDLLLKKYNAVIFVNGCFWHAHQCSLFKWPKTRQDFWREKILGNKKRDKINRDALQELGWRILTIWECSLKGKRKRDFNDLVDSVVDWLRSSDECNSIEGV